MEISNKTNISQYGTPVLCHKVIIPIDSTNIVKRKCPDGFACNPVIVGDNIVIPYLYNPFIPDEDWTIEVFKVLREDVEYKVTSYEYLGTVVKDNIIYNVMRVL